MQSASVVYETLVEGSITRFMGIFDKGVQDKLGPVRSARPYFTQWVDPLDAAYVHAGGSPEALLKIVEYGIKDANRGQYYSRDYSRAAPHNLYTTSELIMRAIRDNNWETSTAIRHWKFADDPKKERMQMVARWIYIFQGVPSVTCSLGIYSRDKTI